MSRTLLLAGLLVIGALRPSPAMLAASSPDIDGADRAFAENAARGGRVEVAFATLAERKAATSLVRSLARHIKLDHVQANEELWTIARDKDLTLDDEPSADHQSTWMRLQNLEGPAFDQAYVDVVLQEHTKDVEAFDRYRRDGADPDLKAFAQRTLQALRGHLSHAGEARFTRVPSD